MERRGKIARRDWLRLSTAGVLGYSMSGWLENLAADTATNPQRRRSCILLWMNGGPSQMDTFDLKPGQANGGPFKETATSIAGIHISEHLPKIARFMNHMVLVRSMKTKEGDHGRATYSLRTGYIPQGPIQYPSVGALVAKELGKEDCALPNFVSIAPYRAVNPTAFGSGFLGPQFAPLIVGETGGIPTGGANGYEQLLKVKNVEPFGFWNRDHAEARMELLEEMERKFFLQHPGVASQSHRTAYDRAVRLMRTAAAKAFNLEEEPDSLRDLYGRNLFGQGCLLARRLVEQGVPFVEVTMGGANNESLGWDTHQQNFDAVKRLSQVLDPAWATLMEDLKSRGLLDSTLIVWMGEFGRTPRINASAGRDHYPNAWTTVLAGGGLKGGQVIGRTSPNGTSVEDRPVSVPDLLATVCMALGIDPMKQNQSNVGRPIRIVDKAAQPIQEILA
ncbi:MAG TPA: DUF1501 domain-containing protein [Gemmataceae bacterium]|jgi:hypothetical protein|nr:DUF1501 domain-containing protein [Gemmataceae bacterium]